MNKILVFALAILSVSGYAQIGLSSFTSVGRGGATTFATDYQAVGINPANLGWEYKFDGKKVALGFNEMTYSIHSEALTKDQLRQEIKALIANDSTNKFTYDEKIQAAKDFTNSGLAFNVDYGSIGFAFMTEKFGGLGFRINDRMSFYSQLGETASDILFRGRTASYFDILTYVEYDSVTMQYDTTYINNHENLDPDSAMNVVAGTASVPLNFSEILENSEINMSWTREYNLSYGRKIFGKDSTLMIYGGVGIKFLQGIGLMQIESDGETLTAFSAMSPYFGIDYGNAALANPSSVTENSGFLPDAVGKGWGFDLGTNIVIGNKIKLGISVNNIGSMTWDGNVYTAQDTLLYDTENAGLESYNIASQVNNLIGEDGLFKWEGESEKTVQLPTLVRAGASIRFSPKVEIGCDLLLPTNTVPGSLEGALFGLGADITPIRWLNLSGGLVTGGNYDFSFPVGIGFIAGNGGFEAGVASRDAITFFAKNGPTLSLSMGFMRFRF